MRASLQVLGFLDGNPLTASDLDRLFLRSIRAPPAKETEERAGALMDLAGPVGLVSKEWSKARSAIKTTVRMKMSGKATSTMSQYNFMGALVRLANVKYRNLPTLESRFDAMCTERLAPHVYDELNLLGDTISKLMLLPPMTAVWEKSRASVEKVFRFYAARDMSLESRFQTTTMNMRELNEMCEDAKVGGLHLPVRDTLLAFARVNIEDEIYQQVRSACAYHHHGMHAMQRSAQPPTDPLPAPHSRRMIARIARRSWSLTSSLS